MVQKSISNGHTHIYTTIRSHSHTEAFENIYLTLTEGVQKPVIIASNVRTDQRKITVDLPRTLVPSNACKRLIKLSL